MLALPALLLLSAAALLQVAWGKPCTHYAYWTDHGCRTWSSPCATHQPTSHIETLYSRNGTAVGPGLICAEPPDFRDGPRATASAALCRQHCLKGDKGVHGGGGGHPPSAPKIPKGPVDLVLHTDQVTHQISPLAMGCHSDSGYAHQARGIPESPMVLGLSLPLLLTVHIDVFQLTRNVAFLIGFYSQMIVGDSFNATGYPDGRWNVEKSD
eukprot:SAG31_NODE_9796_length_1226_cov_1.090506_2_plen_210_part_01